MKRLIFALVFAVFSSGCGGGGSSFSAATLYSCDHQGIANEAYCEEFSPAAQGSFSSADVDLLRANCSSGTGLSATACTTTARIGTCDRSSLTGGGPFSIPVSVARHHYPPAGTAERADCVTNFGDSAWTQHVECLGTEAETCACADAVKTCSDYQWSSCQYVPTYCDDAVFLGLLSGDSDPYGDNFTGRRGNGDGWYTVTFVENDSSLFGVDLTGTIVLDSFAGANFDLDVFCMTCGGALIQSSANGAGILDKVEVWNWDRWGKLQTFTVLIHVKRADWVCAQWDLYVYGNTVITTSNTACGD